MTDHQTRKIAVFKTITMVMIFPPGNESRLPLPFAPFPPICRPSAHFTTCYVDVLVPLWWGRATGRQGTAGTPPWCKCSLPRQFSRCLLVSRPMPHCEIMLTMILHRLHAQAGCWETRNRPNEGWWSPIPSGFSTATPSPVPACCAFDERSSF